MTRLLAGWMVVILLGLSSSIPVAWYRFTSVIAWGVYLGVALLTFIFLFVIRRSEWRLPGVPSWRPRVILGIRPIFPASTVLIWIFLILAALGAYLLATSSSQAALVSPWQTIQPYYLPIFFFLTVLLGIFLFSRLRVPVVLGLILAHSVLLHLYLPLTHELPWGGDVWRHVAVEERLEAGEFYPPVLFGKEAKRRVVLGLSVPEALVIPNKYSYGQLWGTTVLLSKTLQIDLLVINQWLMPILWSLLLPLIFFRIGGILFGSWRAGLLLAALAGLPFSLQALGSLTLPVSLGYLTFFFVLMLWLQYLRDGDSRQRWLALALGGLMFFGYSLFALLLWFLIIANWLSRPIAGLAEKRVLGFRGALMKKMVVTALAFAALWVLPLMEVISGFSRWPAHLPGLSAVSQIIGEFSGWFFARVIRPHDSLSGNILFNHTPENAFVSNFFTAWRWPVFVTTMLISAVVAFALIQLQHTRDKRQWYPLAWLSLLAGGGYLIGWFVLEGERLFTRRLDGLLAFLILIWLVQGILTLIAIAGRRWNWPWWPQVKSIALLVAIGLMSWFATTVYASGPDGRVVSRDEYQAARLIWDQEVFVRDAYCVIADTWVLLPLEGVSHGRIAGGGFSLSATFAQAEREYIFREMRRAPRPALLKFAKEKTGAESCWAVLPAASLDAKKEELLAELFLHPGERLGELVVWAP